MLGPEQARVLLGTIRLANGTIALVAPDRVVRTFGLDPRTNSAALYVLRLFGIRTVCLGLDLLVSREEDRRRTIDQAVYIHATDTAAAVTAGLRGDLPAPAAAVGAVTSSVNTALSLILRDWGATPGRSAGVRQRSVKRSRRASQPGGAAGASADTKRQSTHTLTTATGRLARRLSTKRR